MQHPLSEWRFRDEFCTTGLTRTCGPLRGTGLFVTAGALLKLRFCPATLPPLFALIIEHAQETAFMHEVFLMQ